jgi:hypothetical protein
MIPYRDLHFRKLDFEYVDFLSVFLSILQNAHQNFIFSDKNVPSQC